MVSRFVTIVLTSLFLSTSVHAVEKASESRQQEIERRGTQVMPFSQERTLHIFTKTRSGGIQQVIVKDSSDAGQIALIRGHLNKISKEFAQGNFSDPAKIHGNDMPGLQELERSRPGQIKIEYKEIPNGGQIVYSSGKPELIEAIHRWFDAQLADHGAHAVSGHVNHPKGME